MKGSHNENENDGKKSIQFCHNEFHRIEIQFIQSLKH